MSSIVSHKFKFIFCHIPRTSGTSFSVAVRPFLGQQWLIPKVQAKDYSEIGLHLPIRKLLTEENRDYFKFTFIRNPFDRAISLFARTRSMWNGCFDLFLESDYQWQRRETFCPIENYLLDDNGEEIFDAVFRFENLFDELEVISKTFGIDFDLKDYPHETKTKHRNYRDCFTDETRQIIEDRCKWEINRFGYCY